MISITAPFFFSFLLHFSATAQAYFEDIKTAIIAATFPKTLSFFRLLRSTVGADGDYDSSTLTFEEAEAGDFILTFTLTHSYTHLRTYYNIHSLTYHLLSWRNRSLTHLFTHSLIHTLTHSSNRRPCSLTQPWGYCTPNQPSFLPCYNTTFRTPLLIVAATRQVKSDGIK